MASFRPLKIRLFIIKGAAELPGRPNTSYIESMADVTVIPTLSVACHEAVPALLGD
jgi:hypothetical protein